MNLPNRLSLLRIGLIPVIVVLLSLPGNICWWLALAVFVIASATDFMDGYIARKFHLVTNFGKFIDPVADKLLVLSTLIMLCWRNLMVPWVVILILARELSVDGLRMIAVGSGRVIAAGQLGKLKTVSQIVLILLQFVLRKPVFEVGFPNISTLFTVWVVAITLWSGVDYFVQNKSVLWNESQKKSGR